MKEKILIADGNNLSLRAMYGCAPLYDSFGFPTGCLMTSVRMIAKAAVAVRPARTIFVWDGGHSNYRKQLYPEYKFRPPLDEDDPKATVLSEWKQQVNALKEYLPLLGVGQIQIKGCEADDLIYRLKTILTQAGYDVVIATTDADFFQLVDDNCFIYHLAREKLYDKKLATEENGVEPHNWVDLRAMTGDDSDNISGVKGVGPKKATSIIKEFGNLELFEVHCLQHPEWLAETAKKHHHDVFDNLEIVKRNRALMDLDKLPESEVPQRELESLLDQAILLEPDKKAFWNCCLRHGLNTLMQESHMWPSLYKY